MPLYEYECEACGHRFEKIQKFSDPQETTCPKCGGVVHKLMSSPAIQFKGTGWYITDYAKKDSTPAARAEGLKGEKGDAKGAGAEKSSTETKTETKSESTPPKTDTKGTSG